MTGAFNRERLPDWPSYADTIGAKLTGTGKWRTTACQLHGGSDSMRVNTASGGWVCMACQAHGGDVLAHRMQSTGEDFKTAAQALGAWDPAKAKHTETAPRTLSARDAMELMVSDLGVCLIVISDIKSGAIPNDADWTSFLQCAGRLEALAMEFRK